jgi:hypothetical protein
MVINHPYSLVYSNQHSNEAAVQAATHELLTHKLRRLGLVVRRDSKLLVVYNVAC